MSELAACAGRERRSRIRAIARVVSVDPKTLLIPDNRRMDFHFQASPRRLSLAASSQYNVTRAAYVELSGEDPQNIPEAVAGVLVAQFRTDPCS